MGSRVNPDMSTLVSYYDMLCPLLNMNIKVYIYMIE